MMTLRWIDVVVTAAAVLGAACGGSVSGPEPSGGAGGGGAGGAGGGSGGSGGAPSCVDALAGSKSGCASGATCADACKSGAGGYERQCKCADGAWACDFGACAQECPGTMPSMGQPCPVEGESCSYAVSCNGPATASCHCGGGKWFCTVPDCPPPMPPPCPATKPQWNSTCTASGQQCAYPTGCPGFPEDLCQCVGNKWSCSVTDCAPACPASPPQQGAYCGQPTSCSYPNPNGCGGVYCNCQTGKWTCGIGDCPDAGPACPAAKPYEGQSCSGQGGLSCGYSGWACSCGKWGAGPDAGSGVDAGSMPSWHCMVVWDGGGPSGD